MSPPPTPAKLRIYDIDLVAPEGLQVLEAQFNPEQLELGIKAVWKKHEVPGMSHQHKQFSHTENISLTFDLYFRVHAPQQTQIAPLFEASTPEITDAFMKPIGERYPTLTIAQREYAERFLLSLCVPRSEAYLTRNAPPRILVVWPNFLSFEAVAEEVKFRYTEFNARGMPVEFTASLTVEEIRDVRFTAEYTRRTGWERSEKRG